MIHRPPESSVMMCAAPEDPAGGGEPLAVIDMEIFEELQEEMEETLPVLVQRYLENLSPGIATIRQALTDGDIDALAKTAHRMKGASLALGAEAMGALFQHLERMGRDGDLTAARNCLDDLESGHAAVKNRLQALVSPS